MHSAGPNGCQREDVRIGGGKSKKIPYLGRKHIPPRFAFFLLMSCMVPGVMVAGWWWWWWSAIASPSPLGATEAATMHCGVKSKKKLHLGKKHPHTVFSCFCCHYCAWCTVGHHQANPLALLRAPMVQAAKAKERKYRIGEKGRTFRFSDSV